MIMVLIIGMLTFLPGPDARPIRVPMWFFCTSTLVFFAFRWHSLRKRVFSGQVSPAEFREDPRRHLLGPRLPLVLWFVATIVILIGIVVIEAMFHL